MPKYRPYPFVDLKDRQWPDRVLDKAPLWCSVDLRDGNQALPNPMGIEAKLRMFAVLCQVGFKQIEVGFPSASQIEYDFQRRLIEENRVPADVTLQVLTQTRSHLIERTVESLAGAKKAIIHIYNSTSEQQRRITFGGKTKEEIKQIALDGVDAVIAGLPRLKGTQVTLQYSPESFTGTELDYSLEVCEAVIERWNPAKRGKIILNLPSTVELSLPNIYADRIEWFCRHLSQRDQVILSLHTHNDRGTGTASTELGLLAGADRVEGTLFGNGERTGNLDIINVALNLFTQGVDPKLKLDDLPRLRQVYEETTGMRVPERHPYAGDLVFTAFSGSHQDAIAKGLAKQSADPEALWDVPYLPIDPQDIGRGYEPIIRVNSQSGKGGVAFILEKEYGIHVPKAMQPDLGKATNEVSDRLVRELSPEEIFDTFNTEFVERRTPLSMNRYDIHSGGEGEGVVWSGRFEVAGKSLNVEDSGNGSLDAFVHALNHTFRLNFTIEDFVEQSLGHSSEAVALTFIAVKIGAAPPVWGCGRATDSTKSGFLAVLSALNRASAAGLIQLQLP